MNDTATQSQEHRQADLMALHRQLQDMAARIKESNQSPKDQSRPLQGPTLVIRGK